jgi:hypothetical protein
MIQKRKQSKMEFNSNIDKVEEGICERADQLKQLIDQEKQILVEELTSCKRDRFKQIDNVIEQLEQHVSFAESLVKYAEELKVKGTGVDVVQQTSSVRGRTGELLKLEAIQQAVNNLGSIDIAFIVTDWTMQSRTNIIGKVHKQLDDGRSPLFFKLSIYFKTH